MKTAPELKLPEDIYNGLKQVLEELETGKLVHHDPKVHPYPPRGFNMAEWKQANECGTVVCMGGRLAQILGVEDHYNVLYSTTVNQSISGSPLYKLFMASFYTGD